MPPLCDADARCAAAATQAHIRSRGSISRAVRISRRLARQRGVRKPLGFADGPLLYFRQDNASATPSRTAHHNARVPPAIEAVGVRSTATDHTGHRQYHGERGARDTREGLMRTGANVVPSHATHGLAHAKRLRDARCCRRKNAGRLKACPAQSVQGRKRNSHRGAATRDRGSGEAAAEVSGKIGHDAQSLPDGRGGVAAGEG